MKIDCIKRKDNLKIIEVEYFINFYNVCMIKIYLSKLINLFC